jgi:hypothetical protein
VHVAREADGRRRVAEIARVELGELGPMVRRVPPEAGP